jgi:hypothetical protein
MNDAGSCKWQRAIAKQLGAIVGRHMFRDDFAPQRQRKDVFFTSGELGFRDSPVASSNRNRPKTGLLSDFKSKKNK